MARSWLKAEWLHPPWSNRLPGHQRSEEKTSGVPFHCFWVLLSSELLITDFMAGNLLLFSLTSTHFINRCLIIHLFLWGVVAVGSKLQQTDGSAWSRERPGSPELLRATPGSLSDFFSDFSQTIQLFYCSLSLPSRGPSGGRNLSTHLPRRRIMKNSCLKSTWWELTFKTELLMPWQTSAFFAQGMNVMRNRLL